jgi:hypothetical protein
LDERFGWNREDGRAIQNFDNAIGRIANTSNFCLFICCIFVAQNPYPESDFSEEDPGFSLPIANLRGKQMFHGLSISTAEIYHQSNRKIYHLETRRFADWPKFSFHPKNLT